MTYDRFVDTETAMRLCECTAAAIRGACFRGSLTRYGTPRRPAWDLKELAAWASAREKRRHTDVA